MVMSGRREGKGREGSTSVKNSGSCRTSGRDTALLGPLLPLSLLEISSVSMVSGIME